MKKLLHINSSARHEGSASRLGGKMLIDRLKSIHGDLSIRTREAVDGAAFLTEEWIGASFTKADNRSSDQNTILETSNRLAREVLDADILVLSVSMYNFNLSSAMKAWIDQIVRPGITFRPDADEVYVGLASGKTAYVIVSTGETPVGGPMDFASPYILHVLGFIGIDDIHVIAADMTVTEPETLKMRIASQLDSIAATAAA